VTLFFWEKKSVNGKEKPSLSFRERFLSLERKGSDSSVKDTGFSELFSSFQKKKNLH